MSGPSRKVQVNGKFPRTAGGGLVGAAVDRNFIS